MPICKLQDTGYLASHIDLLPRQAHPPDDYSCGPGSPCRNGERTVHQVTSQYSNTDPFLPGACCPKATGQCNYGPKACGTTGTSPNDVCWSNCDAKAECGRYANPPGKKCPLNVVRILGEPKRELSLTISSAAPAGVSAAPRRTSARSPTTPRRAVRATATNLDPRIRTAMYKKESSATMRHGTTRKHARAWASVASP